METSNMAINERLKIMAEHSAEAIARIKNNEFSVKEAKLISKKLDGEMREITALLMAGDNP